MTLIDHSARAHSPVGGSTAKRVLNCTGSVRLCAKWPNLESEYAAKGTCLHEAIDLIFQGRTKKDTDVIGLVFNGIAVTQDDYDTAIAPALEMWDKIDKELGGVDYFNEKRVTFPDMPLPEVDEFGEPTGRMASGASFGTVDIVGKTRDRNLLWDWKFGAGVGVEAEFNSQLLYYAYAAANTPGTAEMFDRDKPFELFICQPLVNSGPTFTRWVTTWLQIEAFALELRRAVEKAFSDEAEFKLGSWCKFCNGKPGCDLFNNRVSTVRGLTTDQTAAEIAKYLPYADDMIAWAKYIKDLAHDMLEKGAKIPGYKLVNKRADRSYPDEDLALKFMAKAGIPASERHVKKLLSPAQTEATLKRLGLHAELPDQFMKKKLVAKESSGTTLAPESDKRPAVTLAPDALRALADRLAAR